MTNEQKTKIISLRKQGNTHDQRAIWSALIHLTTQALTRGNDVALDTASANVQNPLSALIEAGVAEA